VIALKVDAECPEMEIKAPKRKIAMSHVDIVVMRIVLKEGIEGPVGVEGLGLGHEIVVNLGVVLLEGPEVHIEGLEVGVQVEGVGAEQGLKEEVGAEQGLEGEVGVEEGLVEEVGIEEGLTGGRGRGGPGRRGRGRGGHVAEIPWKWTDTKGPDNKPALFDFSGDLPGPKREAIGVTDPLECYHLFIPKAF